jgi:hypothetical protein
MNLGRAQQKVKLKPRTSTATRRTVKRSTNTQHTVGEGGIPHWRITQPNHLDSLQSWFNCPSLESTRMLSRSVTSRLPIRMTRRRWQEGFDWNGEDGRVQVQLPTTPRPPRQWLALQWAPPALSWLNLAQTDQRVITEFHQCLHVGRHHCTLYLNFRLQVDN